MSKKKEYENRLWEHEEYNGFDYLNQNEVKALRQDVKERCKNGSFLLAGCNNRATVRKTENGYVLTSYYTDVASFENGEFKKLWKGYSATTAKHIHAFRLFLGLPGVGKHEWIMMETA